MNQDLLNRSREIMQTVDSAFGGQAYSRLLANPEMQVWLRRFMLSPDWTLSRLHGAANMLLNMEAVPAIMASGAAGTAFELAENGFDVDHLSARGFVGGAALGAMLRGWAGRVNQRMLTKGDIAAREARKMYSAAILGGFFAANLMNHAFTGKFMWENPEGDRLKVIFPDGSRFGFGKAYKEVFEFAGSEEKYQTLVLDRARSKLSVPISSAIEILSNQSWNGAIIQADSEPWEQAGSMATWATSKITPITATGPIRETAAVIDGRTSFPAAVARGVLRGGGIDIRPPRRESPLPVGLAALQSSSALSGFINRNLLSSRINGQ